jgi:hypothetical protein
VNVEPTNTSGAVTHESKSDGRDSLAIRRRLEEAEAHKSLGKVPVGFGTNIWVARGNPVLTEDPSLAPARASPVASCRIMLKPFIRNFALRRDAVDEAREMLAKLRQEVVGRHARLAGHGLHLILAENRPQLLR